MLTQIKNYFKRFFLSQGPVELSYTKISTYRFCPQKYKLINEEGKRVPPNPYISLGLSVHKALELFHKEGRDSLDELLDIYARVWVNEGFDKFKPQQNLHFYEKGEKMLNQYFAWQSSRKSEIFAVEKEFRFYAGSRVLRGIIDRIDKLPDDTYEIIDYKTHAELWDQERIDTDLQLTLYALGVKRVMNIDAAALSFFFLAHNKIVTTHRTEVQEKAALKLLEEVAQKIEARDFTPNTESCPRCDFRAICKYSAAKPVHDNGLRGARV